MADYGVGALGGVVLIDPTTGLPYKAEGGGGGAVRIESGALVGVPLYASPDDLPAEGVLGGLYFVNAGQ